MCKALMADSASAYSKRKPMALSENNNTSWLVMKEKLYEENYGGSSISILKAMK